MLRYCVLLTDDEIYVEISEKDFRKGLVEYGDEKTGEAFDRLKKDLELEARRK